MAFRFVRTGTGELSGPSMIYQIEQGFDDTAASAEETRKTAEQAEATANKALEEATEATAVADVALKTAQDAQASAGAAQNRADEAWNAATGGGESAEAAMQRANAAYELADTANANALGAQSKADAATTAAEEAATSAGTAADTATEATATANEAISKAGTAEFVAQQASSDVQALKAIIGGLESAADEFEADSYTTSLDGFVSALVKKYITGTIASALPDGVSAPFWFYNWSTNDLSKTFQFIQTNTGAYGRSGTPSGIAMRDGEDTFYIQFKSGTSASATSIAISCADNALTAAGQRGFTWTVASTPARGLVGTLAWEAATPDGTEIVIGDRVVAAVTGGKVVVSDASPFPSTNAALALTGGTIAASSTTLEISFVWTSLDASGCTWDSWKVDMPAVDNVTIKYNSSNELQAKDIAIDGDESDLASARGQIGDAKEMPNLDFNTLTTPGNYRITGNPTNGPSLPLNISGASIGSLIVAGIPGQNGHIFQIMISGSAVTWRTIQDSTGTTWSAWQQLLSGNKVGDGIRVTNGIISVPEMQGATASTDGTSGLVPPAAAGQANYALCGDGEWRDLATHVAGDFVPDSRRVIAGTGLTGGGPLSSNVTLAAKLTDSVSLTDSTTAASATAVKTAYDLANSKQANFGFTPVQQGGGSGQNNTKIYIGSAGASGLKAQQGTTDLGNIVTTKAGTTRAPSATKVYVENFGEMSWISTQYANSPANVWCLPVNTNYAHLCSPSMLSVGASQLTITSPNTRIFKTNGNLPAGGSWVVIVSRNGNGVVAQLAGGTAVDTSGGVALAIRVQ